MANPIQVTKEEVEAAFAMCNEQSPHLLKVSDLKLVMRGLGFEPRNAQIDEMTNKVKQMKEKQIRGKECPDMIDVDEFLSLLKNEQSETDKSVEEMRSAFRLFDKEEKGFITVQNLQQVAKELGERMEIDDLEEMITEAAKSTDGKVSEEDFFAIMKKTCLY